MRQTTSDRIENRDLLPHLFEIIFKKLEVNLICRFVFLFEINLLNHIVYDKNVAALKRHNGNSLNYNIYKTTEISHQLLACINFSWMIDHLGGYKEIVSHENPLFITLWKTTNKSENLGIGKHIICFKILALSYIQKTIVFLRTHRIESAIFGLDKVVSYKIIVISVFIYVQNVLLKES